MRARAAGALLLCVALLGACRASAAFPRGGPFYETNATVLQAPGDGPELCLGGIALSNPPQCGGPPVAGWDWRDVSGEERAGGVTWGRFRVVGSYRGDVFTVVGAGPPEDEEVDAPDNATPCPEPAGGWPAPDPRKASEWHTDRAAQRAEEEPDFAGVWQDYDEHDRIILSVAFTGALERHERELRRFWGGPLCLVERDHTYRELHAIADALAKELGPVHLGTGIDVSAGKLEAEVIVADAATEARIEEKYGAVVEVRERLRPVD